ncbi:MAG: D-glycerate dehydrogenase [Saprospiraceae bacterium]
MVDQKTLKIFISKKIPAIGIKMLQDEGYELKIWPNEQPIPQNILINESKQADILLSLGENKIDPYFLNECKHLKMISQFAVGYDNINIPEATKLGIPIGNTPDVLSAATADIAFGLMISVSRKFFYNYKKIIDGDWGAFQPTANLGQELHGKTLGIFGLGAIGTVMAQRCKGAYDMDILYYNRSRNEDAERHLNARQVEFDELLAQSDVLSVHSVLSDETRGKFNYDVFSKMKPTSIFINTSRGGVHNETDLITALQNNIIWGAGLDVTNPEPMAKDNPLLFMENVCVLPHIGSATIEARDGMSRLAAVNIISYMKSGVIPHCVNPSAIL